MEAHEISEGLRVRTLLDIFTKHHGILQMGTVLTAKGACYETRLGKVFDASNDEGLEYNLFPNQVMAA